MKYFQILFILVFLLSSCSTKKQILYLKDIQKNPAKNLDESAFSSARKSYNISRGDILYIDISSIVPEAAILYNKSGSKTEANSVDFLKIQGYLVDELMNINYPVLGKISVEGLNLNQLEEKITKLLLEGGHLTNFTVKVRRVNSKFTVLGEVSLPGTYSYLDESLNIFQAIGYAGDLTIDGKRKDITLIREEGGKSKIFKINLTKSDLLKQPYFYIKNNDVIIVAPNFRKVKTAGFIGSPQSIASISSILLSITLLILNK